MPEKGKRTAEEDILREVGELISWVMGIRLLDLRSFEQQLLPRLWSIGRLLVHLFIEKRRAEVEAELTGTRWAVPRNIATTFGKVVVSRMYLPGDDGHGQAPLDRALGLGADLVSPCLLGLTVLLATQMPFDHVRQVLGLFVGYVPSAKTIKHAVLGIGSLAQRWLDTAPLPQDDGEVLVAMFDSKAVPTATDAELRKRRGKHKRQAKAPSPRHRGRHRRARWAPKRRRRKGDKSKNGRMCTVAVMYTLKRQGKLLLGPINKRLYVSFGPKELAFQWAQRQATRRRFSADSDKIQVVTDGDDDLAIYTRRYFPKARHTLDVYHALEYVWEAGSCLHREGSPQLDRWYQRARKRVFDGKIDKLLDQLRTAFDGIPRTGPGNKSRRERLDRAIGYLTKRVPMMNYAWLSDQDLEMGSGAAEGAVNHLVALRFDHGGMRWIRERAQALLQLRCIHQNGDWHAFLDWALPQLTQPSDDQPIPRILRKVPAPLPDLLQAA